MRPNATKLGKMPHRIGSGSSMARSPPSPMQACTCRRPNSRLTIDHAARRRHKACRSRLSRSSSPRPIYDPIQPEGCPEVERERLLPTGGCGIDIRPQEPDPQTPSPDDISTLEMSMSVIESSTSGVSS